MISNSRNRFHQNLEYRLQPISAQVLFPGLVLHLHIINLLYQYFSEEIKANQEPYDEELKLISNLMVYSLRFEVPSTANGPNSTPSPSVHNGFLCVPGQVPSRRGSDQSRDSEIQYRMIILSKYLKLECSSSRKKSRYKY